MKKLKIARWLASSWLTVTTILLCLPGNALPKENWFDKIWLDKWIHIGLFTVMVFLWCEAFRKKSKGLFLRIFILAVLYGIAMEFVQKYFIPNRSFDLLDMCADGIGGAVGLFVSLRLLQKNRPL